MATFFLDRENGNDANDGTTFANRWKTLTSGATSVRIAPGDVIREIASPDPTLVGNATWTHLSKTVALATAVTANIATCDTTAWTAAANVTATASTTAKEGTHSAQMVIAAAFATGRIAHFPTGTLNLSAYQQVSFMVNTNLAVAAGALSLRLCSDTAGAVTVDTLALPAIPTSTNTLWIPITVDKGSALGSAIQSVALYADLDPGALTIRLDNIIACKASSSNDALTLNSIIGKVSALSWVASTVYATNDIRKPTPPNRNGLRYRVTAGGGGSSGSGEPTWPTAIGATVADGALTWTCEGLEESWRAIQSINGTTVLLDNDVTTLAAAGRGYTGTTETIATYKREGVKVPMAATNTTASLQDSGTRTSPITVSGGWDRTAMTAQTGETWLNGQNGVTAAFTANTQSGWVFENIGGYRCGPGFSASSLANSASYTLRNCHFNNGSTGILSSGSVARFTLRGVQANNHSTVGLSFNSSFYNHVDAFAIAADGNLSNGVLIPGGSFRANLGSLRNCAAAGIGFATGETPNRVLLCNFNIDDNGGAYAVTGYDVSFVNSILADTLSFTTGADNYVRSHKNGQVADTHLLSTYGGTIRSSTAQRHTASGIAWLFNPTATARSEDFPLRLSVAKLACAAGVPVSVTIWVYRDNANIKGQLVMPGGQLTGIGDEVSAAVDTPTINTWVESTALTFTPTEDGVVEIEYRCWDGVGTTNSLWIDDLAVT